MIFVTGLNLQKYKNKVKKKIKNSYKIYLRKAE